MANTTLLLHMNGSNGSTVFTDVKGHAVTANGNAQISTAQFKFGGASGLFDGAGDFLTTPFSTDFALETGSDFTVECWIRLSATGIFHHLVENRSVANINGWVFRIESSNVLRLFFVGGSSVSGATALTSGTFHHIAATRSGNTVRLFLNGIQDASATFANGATSSSGLTIGAFADGTFALNGHMDELRITNDTARYTANFAVPSAAFPDIEGIATLTWNDNSNNELGFLIERKLSASSVFSGIGSVARNTTTFVDNTVQLGQSYDYRVKAFNDTGINGNALFSNPSNTASISIPL